MVDAVRRSASAHQSQLGRRAELMKMSENDPVMSLPSPAGFPEPSISPTAHATTCIMGLPFDRVDHPTLIGLFLDGVRERNGGWIVTPNLDILRQFTICPDSRRLILSASHRVADGQPIVWASRLVGSPVPGRIPGSDLVLSLPEAAARAGLSVFLLGGNPGVAAAAASRLEAQCPGLRRVGSYCPPYGFEDNPRELAKIKKAVKSVRPALVLIGLGFPKQERLIRLLRSELPETWFVGVGISLSFLARDQPRAPVVLQRLGLEWLHRLVHEPRRLFGRYVTQGLPFGVRLFAWAVTERLFGHRRAPADGRSRAHLSGRPEHGSDTGAPSDSAADPPLAA
jgi:N-acetylglucosaminyldiphosphoundecaprenol N-acetyl-beta-D-mannosaminyltransferase